MVPLTRLGHRARRARRRGRRSASTIELLGIPAGPIDVQRLFYWHVVKAFYRPGPDLRRDEPHQFRLVSRRATRTARRRRRYARWCAEAGLDDRARERRGGGHHDHRAQATAAADVRHRRHPATSTASRSRRSLLQRMTDAIAHRGPDGEGSTWTGRCRLRPPPAGDHRPVAGRPPADGDADGRYVLSYNGEVYNFRELRVELEALGLPVPLAAPTPRSCCTRSRSGARARSTRFNGMFALRLVGHARSASCCSPATATASSRSTSRTAATTLAVRLGDQGALAHPGAAARCRPAGACSNTSRSRTSSPTARCSRASGCCRPARTCGSIVPDRPEPRRRATGTSISRAGRTPRDDDELRRGARPAVPPGRHRQLVSDVAVGAYLSGGMDSGSITAVAARQLPDLRTFTCGFDLQLGLGHRAGVRRARARPSTCPICSRPSTTRWCSRPATWSACCRGSSGTSRTARRPELPEFLRRAARQQVRQGRAVGRRRRRAVRRLPVALLPRGRQRRLRALRRQVLRLLAAPAVDERRCAACLAPIWRDVADVSTRDIFRDVFPVHARATSTRPEDYINHSLYFEAKTFLHGLLVVEDKLTMAHGLETRVPFLDNDLVDFAHALPVRLKLGNLGEVVRSTRTSPGDKTAQLLPAHPRRQADPAATPWTATCPRWRSRA